MFFIPRPDRIEDLMKLMQCGQLENFFVSKQPSIESVWFCDGLLSLLVILSEACIAQSNSLNKQPVYLGGFPYLGSQMEDATADATRNLFRAGFEASFLAKYFHSLCNNLGASFLINFVNTNSLDLSGYHFSAHFSNLVILCFLHSHSIRDRLNNQRPDWMISGHLGSSMISACFNFQ